MPVVYCLRCAHHSFGEHSGKASEQWKSPSHYIEGQWFVLSLLPPDNNVLTQQSAFYNGNDRFYIRGVAYQPGGSSNVADPLLDTTTLANDIKNFQTLGINTIRMLPI